MRGGPGTDSHCLRRGQLCPSSLILDLCSPKQTTISQQICSSWGTLIHLSSHMQTGSAALQEERTGNLGTGPSLSQDLSPLFSAAEHRSSKGWILCLSYPLEAHQGVKLRPLWKGVRMETTPCPAHDTPMQNVSNTSLPLVL